MTFAPRTTRAPRGFTLLELLTVVAIIGVLAAVLLAALGVARRSARTTSDLGTMRSLGQAMLQYAAENKGMINTWGRTPGRPLDLENTYWGRAWPYLRDTPLRSLNGPDMREVANSYLSSVIQNERPDLIANNDGINYTIALNRNLGATGDPLPNGSGNYVVFQRMQSVPSPAAALYATVGKYGFWSLTPAPLPATQPSEGVYWPYHGTRTIAVHLDGSTALRREGIDATRLRNLSR